MTAEDPTQNPEVKQFCLDDTASSVQITVDGEVTTALEIIKRNLSEHEQLKLPENLTLAEARTHLLDIIAHKLQMLFGDFELIKDFGLTDEVELDESQLASLQEIYQLSAQCKTIINFAGNPNELFDRKIKAIFEAQGNFQQLIDKPPIIEINGEEKHIQVKDSDQRISCAVVEVVKKWLDLVAEQNPQMDLEGGRNMNDLLRNPNSIK